MNIQIEEWIKWKFEVSRGSMELEKYECSGISLLIVVQLAIKLKAFLGWALNCFNMYQVKFIA